MADSVISWFILTCVGLYGIYKFLLMVFKEYIKKYDNNNNY